MIRSLYTAVSGMITQEAKQDVITSNLANVNTVGFKVDNMAAKEFDQVLLYNYDKIVGGKNVRQDIGTISLGSKIDDVVTNFTQGMIQKTDKPFDFAIEGGGFFVVQRNDGVATNNYYTRDGHFHLNSKGFLVNDSGDNVMGRNVQSGALEPIKLTGDEATADSNGNISINNRPTYKLQLVDFRGNNAANDYKSLKKVGDNLYSGNNAREYNDITVRQYNLEKSNVNVAREIMDMMTVMRTFETTSKVIQTIDETLGKAVNEVGSVR
ncbi:flagellar basal-body rod protein FlgG [Clostridium tetanomorphum]|uniref:Flagellar basal body rod protein FlgG n=1 Tax=Clostridium tetanomorphum TaxID=1553 RepID=A0A923EA87_CLOTT|nr:flagellar hook-basal body complex protein [Clostridium tetanomorphum]KAJ49933.1 flagellar basal body rod protein FlgG [Clostridium tetanomorphum DSM 665]MBC2396663.1 flagellar basal body rod protein FlgG [Clostridium tetanomorphum]MBP1866128.1 flagellar basal-body rod protein FlgG [Clostridium tetanomorphum]NRS85107.1 flagellar basal-body rod protein FlgG [Clostridium tetanomorphum]NRZ98289.1 flagellar basal-body rod protein FlgG [Clostridium tetanomorphum]